MFPLLPELEKNVIHPRSGQKIWAENFHIIWKMKPLMDLSDSCRA